MNCQEKKLLYERIMGTSSVLDDQFLAEEQPRSNPAANHRPPPHSQVTSWNSCFYYLFNRSPIRFK